MAGQAVGEDRSSPLGSGQASGGAAAQDDSVDAIADALLTASRLLVDISRRSIARVDENLTIPQFRVLLILSHQDTVNLSTLSGLLEVKPSAAGRMVNRLVGAELIDRCPHPSSRRELLVALTPRGRKVVREVLVQRRKEIAEIVEHMPTPDRRGLTRGLKAFTTAGGEPAVLLDE
jgi:DNA-binding MarR family transcriptional regulator